MVGHPAHLAQKASTVSPLCGPPASFSPSTPSSSAPHPSCHPHPYHELPWLSSLCQWGHQGTRKLNHLAGVTQPGVPKLFLSHLSKWHPLAPAPQARNTSLICLLSPSRILQQRGLQALPLKCLSPTPSVAPPPTRLVPGAAPAACLPNCLPPPPLSLLPSSLLFSLSPPYLPPPLLPSSLSTFDPLFFLSFRFKISILLFKSIEANKSDHCH